MVKEDPKKPKEAGEEKTAGAPNRDDAARKSSGGPAQFLKDKRKRTRVSGSYEAVSRENRSQRDKSEEDRPRKEDYPGRESKPRRDDSDNRDNRPHCENSGDEERRSYNPNFSKDNKPLFNERRDDRYGRDERPQRKSNDDEKWNRTDYKPSQERKPYGKDDGARKPFRKDDNRSFNRDERDRKPFRKDDNRPFNKEDSDRKPFRKDDNHSFNRDERDRKPFRKDDNRPFNKEDSDRKPFRKDDRSERSFSRGDRPGSQGDRKKPFGKKPFGDRPAQRDYGENYPKFPAPKIDKEMRLNRYMAISGVSSRREADEFIQSGQVSVNGVVVTELGTKIKPGDEVRFNDKILKGEKKVYIIMNKPKGYVTSMEDPHADKTVMDLVKNAVTERVYPVGRLDKNSLGVLLITNDGDLTTRLTHPSYNKKKIYQVALDKPLTRADMEQITAGVTLEDGEIYADEVSYVKDNKREIGIEIHSGRNRIVRRIFEHMGYKVQKLDRVYFAGLTKKNLKRGAWRFLSPREVDMLMSGRYE